MGNLEYETLKAAIERHWPHPAGDKAQRYIGKFFNTTRLGTRLSGQMEGNHGTYTVTFQVGEGNTSVSSACSCYIGKGGYCHHCHALGLTFIQNPEPFVELETRPLEAVEAPDDMLEYLRGVTLDDLVAQLRAIGITQKAFAASIGMSTQHLSAVKASERRNRYFHELGALKVACLWFLEHFKKDHHGE